MSIGRTPTFLYTGRLSMGNGMGKTLYLRHVQNWAVYTRLDRLAIIAEEDLATGQRMVLTDRGKEEV